MPEALHSSRSFRRLCSGALRDGRIIRLDREVRGLVPTSSDSRVPPSFITGRSPLLRTVADTRSFHILPSWWSKGIRFQNPKAQEYWINEGNSTPSHPIVQQTGKTIIYKVNYLQPFSSVCVFSRLNSGFQKLNSNYQLIVAAL